MRRKQIKNHKGDNLQILIRNTRVLLEIILTFRHLKYRSVVMNVKMDGSPMLTLLP
jgi:hypothetical protein